MPFKFAENGKVLIRKGYEAYWRITPNKTLEIFNNKNAILFKFVYDSKKGVWIRKSKHSDALGSSVEAFLIPNK
jgi:hypothetical protein